MNSNSKARDDDVMTRGLKSDDVELSHMQARGTCRNCDKNTSSSHFFRMDLKTNILLYLSKAIPKFSMTQSSIQEFDCISVFLCVRLAP